MNARGTMGLTLVLALLLGAYWLTDQIDQNIDRETQQAKKIFDVSPEDVTTFSIAREGEIAVEALRHEDGSWSIAEPFPHIPANQPLWNSLADVIAALTNERTLENAGSDLADFRLDVPRLSIIFGTRQGQLTQLAFGALDPTQVNRYTLLDDEIFLTRNESFTALNRSLDELRDRRALTILNEGFSGIDYQRLATESDPGSEPLDPSIVARTRAIDEQYVLDEEGNWRIEHPVSAVARRDRLNALATQLRFAAAGRFVDAPQGLGDYGLDPPFATLSVHNPSGDSQSLLLGGITGDGDQTAMFAKRAGNPSVFVVDARLFNLLPSAPGHFREKRLFTREARLLTSIHYRDANNDILLQNDEELGWRMTNPAVDDSDQMAISMYIAMLKQIEGTSFPDDDAVPELDTPRITIDFTFAEGNATSSILIGAPAPDSDPIEFYAVQDFGSVTTLPFEAFQLVRVSPFDFREKILFPFEREQVLNIELSFEDSRYTFELADGRWAITEPAGARLEAQSDVHAIIDAFINTFARGVADPPPARDIQGFDAPIVEAVITLGPSPGSDAAVAFGPVRVGNRKTEKSRDRFMTIEGNPNVYYIDQALIDDIREALREIRAAQ